MKDKQSLVIRSVKYETKIFKVTYFFFNIDIVDYMCNTDAGEVDLGMQRENDSRVLLMDLVVTGF